MVWPVYHLNNMLLMYFQKLINIPFYWRQQEPDEATTTGWTAASNSYMHRQIIWTKTTVRVNLVCIWLIHNIAKFAWLTNGFKYFGFFFFAFSMHMCAIMAIGNIVQHVLHLYTKVLLCLSVQNNTRTHAN